MSGKATESDILAWIEGELPNDRVAMVEAAFAADPTLRAWASSMRDDRVVLGAWAKRAIESAPGGLAESALERVERAALLGPSEAETLAAAPERESSSVVFRIRRYATAAAVVLLVGVIGVTGVRFGPNVWKGAQPHAVVKPDSGIERSGNDAAGDPHADLLDAIAMAERDETNKAAESAGSDADAASGIDETQLAAAPELGGARSIMDAESEMLIRPMALEGDIASLLKRLIGESAITGGPVISISSVEAARSIDRVVLRVWAADPEQVAVEMQAACGGPESPAIGWGQVSDSDDTGTVVDGVVCTVEIPGEVAGLNWLANSILESGADRVELTFRDSDGTIPTEQGQGSIDAAGALWWGEPIADWASSARVGVLISPLN